MKEMYLVSALVEWRATILYAGVFQSLEDANTAKEDLESLSEVLRNYCKQEGINLNCIVDGEEIEDVVFKNPRMIKDFLDNNFILKEFLHDFCVDIETVNFYS